MAESSQEPSQRTLALWERDVGTLHDSIGLMLRNRLNDAEQVLVDASEGIQARGVKFDLGEHDLRGCFALVSAIMKLFNGLSSLQQDQLETVLKRIWEADELLQQDRDWAGKTVLRGLCLLVAGLVEVMNRDLAKGTWHVMRSWAFLRHLESTGLNYKGHEHDCVRSTALLALGLFNLLASMLPRQALQAAGWLTGLECNKESAMDQIRICWKEGGIQAPFAALILVGVAVDMSSFLGELQTQQTLRRAESRQVLDWAAEHYQGSFLFEGLEAGLLASQEDLPAAIERLEGVFGGITNLPACKLAVYVRLATFQAGLFDWKGAAASFLSALEIHRAVGRRAGCPTLALTSYLCFLEGSDIEAANKALELCRSYRNEKKKWDYIDVVSLRQAELAYAASCASQRTCDGGDVVGAGSRSSEDSVRVWRPNLILYLRMCLVWRLVSFMTEEQAVKFRRLVSDAMDSCGKSDLDGLCMGFCIHAEAARQREQWDDALNAASSGLALSSKLSPEGRRSGAPQFCLLSSAFSHLGKGNTASAKDALEKLHSLGNDFSFAKQVEFKATRLRQIVGAELRDAYTELVVPAGGAISLVVETPADEMMTVSWDWVLAGFTIDFLAIFKPKSNKGSPETDPVEQKKLTHTELQRISQHASADGPGFGSFALSSLEAPHGGKLELRFDNSFSMIRKKTVHVRVEPRGLKVKVKDR